MLVIRLGFVLALFTVEHIGNTHWWLWYSGHNKGVIWYINISLFLLWSQNHYENYRLFQSIILYCIYYCLERVG